MGHPIVPATEQRSASMDPMKLAAWYLAIINMVIPLLFIGRVLYTHAPVSVTVVEMFLQPHHQHWSSTDDYTCSLVDMAPANGTVFGKNETVSRCIFVEEHKRFPWKFFFRDEGDNNTSILSLQNMSNNTHKTIKIFVKQCNNDRENAPHANTSNCDDTFQSTVSLNTIAHNDSVMYVCLLTSNNNATKRKFALYRTCFLLDKDINSIDIVAKPLSGRVFDLKNIANEIENSRNNNFTFLTECSEDHSCYTTQNLSSGVIPNMLSNSSKAMRNARKISKEIHSKVYHYSYTISNREPYKKQLVNEIIIPLHVNYTRIHKISKPDPYARKISFLEFIKEVCSKGNCIISNTDSDKKQLVNGLTDVHTNNTDFNNISKPIGSTRKFSFLEFNKELISRGNLHSYKISNTEDHTEKLFYRLGNLHKINCKRVHNGSVVEPATFAKIISDKDADVGLQRFKRETGTNESLSQYFDSVLDVLINIAKHYLKKAHKGKIEIPNFIETFARYRVRCTLRALNGWLVGADSMERKRSSEVLKNANNFSISFELQFNALEFGYNNFEAKFLFWEPRGKLKGIVQHSKIEITMNITLLKENECLPTIEKVEVTELKDIRIDISGIGIFSKLASRVASWALEHFKTSVMNVVSAHVEAAMKKAITHFPCGLFTTGIIMNAPN